MLMQDPSLMQSGLGIYNEAMKNDRSLINADAKFRQQQELADQAARNARIAAGIKGGSLSVDPEGAVLPSKQSGKAMEIKQSALDVTNRLLKNIEGVKANRGGVSTMLPNIFDSSVNAEADLETLGSLLTTENLDLLKGVLSDTDMRVLKDIGAGGIKGADDQVLNNLLTIQQKLSGQLGLPNPPAPPPIPGGPVSNDPLAGARDAIARGAPRDAVLKRLQENGIDPAGL
jgi:hypothetical protein